MGKNIFLLFYILLAFDRVSLATESDCRNSNGTNLIFVNGINWTEDTVRWMTYDVLNPALDLKKIEPRIDDVNNVDPELYDIGYSYNHARSLSWDLLESTVGFIANEGIVIEENYLYSVLYKYIFMSVFIINLDYPDSIISFLTSPDGFVKNFMKL